ncbi:hypothetical protein [Dasania marina]|uniref:hypothetical protein n=1 Tax=Dasania marina TaxID=471499 RepID=UPI0030DA35A5
MAALGYIAALYWVEYYTDFTVPEDFHTIAVIAFSLASLILFYIAWWHIKHPATYEAYITSKELSVSYPESLSWSFKVNVADIKRIEHRQTHASGGKSIVRTGALMKNRDFHQISMNYGNNVNEMFKALQSINPEITFSKTIKTNFTCWVKK